MLISQAGADIRPFEDGLAITFNLSTPDPGENVTVTAYFENAGTDSTDTDTFARMYVDGELMFTHREGILQPVAPTGDGNFASFSFGWDGGLGEHTFVLHLDEHQNVTQTRTDNDLTSTVLNIIAPYNVSIGVPSDPIRVLPAVDRRMLRHSSPLPGDLQDMEHDNRYIWIANELDVSRFGPQCFIRSPDWSRQYEPYSENLCSRRSIGY